MEGLLAGDDDAIRTLYARFGRPVYGMGLRLLGTREAAEELTQDVFLTAWRKAARFDPSRGSAVDVADDDRAQPRRGPPPPRDGRHAPHAGAGRRGPRRPRHRRRGGADGARHGDAGPGLAVGSAERRLVLRAYFRGQTAREIAEADGIPLGTVKTRLRAAMIKVRRANEGKEPVTCADVRERLPERALGVLDAREAAEVDRHCSGAPPAGRRSGELTRRRRGPGVRRRPPRSPPPSWRIASSSWCRGRRAVRERAMLRGAAGRLAVAAVVAAMVAVSGLGWGAVMAGKAARSEQQATESRAAALRRRGQVHPLHQQPGVRRSDGARSSSARWPPAPTAPGGGSAFTLVSPATTSTWPS